MNNLSNQSIKRALSILNLFSKDNSELTINEIIKHTEMSKSTAYRFVNDLKNTNLLSYNKQTDKYKLGLKLLDYGMTVLNSIDLREIAYPHLDKLRKDTKENVNLGIIDDTEVVFLERLESERLFRMQFHIGSRVPVHCAAIGKLILSFLPEEEKNEIINNLSFTKLTDNTILNKKELKIELNNIKKQGYAISNREFIDEVKTIAVPIFNSQNKVIAACNITGPYYRFTDNSIKKEILPHLYIASQLISKDLGYKGNLKYIKDVII